MLFRRDYAIEKSNTVGIWQIVPSGCGMLCDPINLAVQRVQTLSIGRNLRLDIRWAGIRVEKAGLKGVRIAVDYGTPGRRDALPTSAGYPRRGSQRIS
jgi:hypothetical protein